jgi:mannose-6-phosphate isomerase-like protein (cupin superfamily)
MTDVHTATAMTEGTDDGIRWLIDSYQNWAQGEGVPIVEDVAVDLASVGTGPWPRMGVDGAFVHVHSRGDLCSTYLLDLPPGGATDQVRHMYEAVYFVIDGQGSTVLETPEGGQLSFEWGKASLFALPMNAPYRLFNSSGRERARVAVVSNLPMVMKQFRDEKYVFHTDRNFPERWTDQRFYRGEGVFIPTREMRHMWETTLVPDVLSFDRLIPSPNRGSGSSNIQFVMGESTMRTHISAVGVGDYKKAHIHGEGVHIIQLGDAGYSLYWREGEEPRRVDWKFGMLHSPADQEWHQHFNIGNVPGRYLPISYGNFRYPFTKANVANVLHRYEIKSKIQIEYEDEDPRIRELFQSERARWQAAHGSSAEQQAEATADRMP